MKKTSRLLPRAAALLIVAGFCGGAVPVFAQSSPEEQLAAASALLDAKKYDEAARRLDAFLVAHPKHPKAGLAALALGRARLVRKEYAQAVPAFEKAVASGDPAAVPSARLGLGEAAIYAGQHAKAATALTQALKSGTLSYAQSATVHYWLGQAHFETGRFAESEAAYTTITRDFSKSEFVDGAHFGAGLAALKQNRADAARQHLRALVDRFGQSPDRPQALFLVARIDEDTKRWPEARAGYEAFLNTDAAKRPDAAGTRTLAEEGLVRALLEMKDYPAAGARLDVLLTRLPAGDPKRPRVHLSLGHSRYRQSQHEAALTAYREAAKSSDAAVAAEGLYWAANAALALSRPADAAPLFAQVAARFPTHKLAARAQLRAGDALLAAKQPDAAAKAYRGVVTHYASASEAADARKALAGLLDATSDPAQLAQALPTMPAAERARGTVRLARLYLDQKKYAQAAAPLDALLKAKPADPALATEAQYLLGLAYEGQNKAAPARAALAEAVRLAPAGATWAGDANTRLAWLYLDLKQPAKAEQAATAALARLGASPNASAQQQARLALVQAQLDQSKWDAALDGARALLAGNPSPDTRAAVLFTQAWATEKRAKTPDEALPLWEQIVREHGQSQYAADALLRVGDAHAKAEKHDEARAQYEALVSGFPNSPRVPEARFKLGSALYSLNRFAEAAGAWDALAAGGKAAGTYAPEALYWAGVAFDKAGAKADAIQRLSRLVANHPTHARVANAKIRLAALKAVSGG